MRWVFRWSDHSRCCDCCDPGRRGAAGDDGLELDDVEGRSLSRLSEDLEEFEKETLWPGDS